MPLVYQGRLSTARIRSPSAAIEAGETALAEMSHHRRLDIRLEWDSPEPFARCAPHLPPDFAGYWVDIAAEVDATRLDELETWARTLEGGRLALACIVPGRENEVACELPGPGPIRLDAERLDPHRSHFYSGRASTLYAERGERTAPSVARRRLAAGRVRAAYEALAPLVGGPVAAYDAVVTDDPRVAPADPRWLDGEEATDRAWFSPQHIDPIARELTDLKPTIADGTPYGLQLTLPPDAQAMRVALWRRWVGLLDRLDLVLLRCMGTRETIEAVLDRFDLHHRHLDRPHQTFGICTVHHPEPIDLAAARAITGTPASKSALVEWGVRWSDVQLKLEGDLDEAARPGRSFYVMRSERRRVYDSLQLSLASEDPQSRALRFARRQLVPRFGATVEQPSAWQYVGPPADSARGQRYSGLRDALSGLPVDILARPQPISALTPSPPGWLGRLAEKIKRDDDTPFDLVSAFDQALAKALPGFRHDRRAHLTTRYFIEFIRPTSAGYHVILLRRLHRPTGFRISIGACLFPLQLADLDPGQGRSAPGLAVPLLALTPERQALDWTYTGDRSARRAVADAVEVLAARAGPYFELADPLLGQFATETEP